MKRAILGGLLGIAACASLNIPAGKDLPQVNNPFDQAQKSFDKLAGNYQCTPAELRRYALTADNEYWFGRSVADRLLASYTPSNVYEPDAPAALYLNEVGQAVVQGALDSRDPGGLDTGERRFPRQARITEKADPKLDVVDDFAGDRPAPTHGYHFILVHDANPGAFGIPGGMVVVTDGMLARAQNEDQLAAVLAHEVAHVQRGHGVLAAQRGMCSGDFTFVQGVKDQAKHSGESVTFANTVLPLDKAVGLVSGLGDALKDKLVKSDYGTLQEQEADAFGVRYLAAAGYAPHALADFLMAVDKDPAFNSRSGNAAHLAPHLRVPDIEKVIADEHLQPNTEHVAERTARFQSTLQGKLRTASRQ